VALGDGGTPYCAVRLFDRPGGDSVRLERVSLTHSPHVTNIWLRVLK
jgi:hypothetical protein